MAMGEDLVQLFEAAKKAADMANSKGIPLGQTDASRCVDALSKLKNFPVSRRILEATRIDRKLERLSKHMDRKICSAASLLLLRWRESIKIQESQDSAASKKPGDSKTQGRGFVKSLKLPRKVSSSKESDQKSQSVPCSAPVNGKDDSREKIRDMLVGALSRVDGEVKEENLKEKVRQCSPTRVASKVEAEMFEKMGPFNGKMKNKYRSIMFNLRDPKNPDLRRKVLFGEVTPERLVDMRTEEMASDEMQTEINKMKQRALQRDDQKIRIVDETIT